MVPHQNSALCSVSLKVALGQVFFFFTQKWCQILQCRWGGQEVRYRNSIENLAMIIIKDPVQAKCSKTCDKELWTTLQHIRHKTQWLLQQMSRTWSKQAKLPSECCQSFPGGENWRSCRLGPLPHAPNLPSQHVWVHLACPASSPPSDPPHHQVVVS